MARAGRGRRRDARAARGAHPAGRHDRRARRDRRGVHPLARRRADLQGLQGLPGRDLPLAERDGRPRHPGQDEARGRRHPLGRRRRHARRLRRRLGLDVPGRDDRPRGAAAARHLPGGARRRDRAGAASGNSIGDISQAVQTVTEAAGFSVIRSLVGHGVGRSMHEDPQVPNFVSSYRGPGAQGGHDDRDRADDHGRRPRTSTSTTTTGRSRPPTARWRPISSTRSRSPPRGPRILTGIGGSGTMTTRAARRLPVCAITLDLGNSG